ncbi:MAG: hypothetical protein ACI8PZ_007114 [Myxococcota bacterium]|jgi:hypothetical protein
MTMWRSEAQGLTSRMSRSSRSPDSGKPLTYRLRAFEDQGEFAWEVWDGAKRVTDGRASSMLLAQAHADAVAAGTPGAVQRRRRPVVLHDHAPPPSDAGPLAVVKLLIASASSMNAVYWTWAFVARGGAVLPMLLSLAVLGVVLAYSGRGMLLDAIRA